MKLFAIDLMGMVWVRLPMARYANDLGMGDRSLFRFDRVLVGSIDFSGDVLSSIVFRFDRVLVGLIGFGVVGFDWVWGGGIRLGLG
jgi:hypothetical protein